MHVLVVGANGQLGSTCCSQLLAGGHAVRGTVRTLNRARNLPGIDPFVIDLTRHPNFPALLADVDAAIITANTAAPRAGDHPADLEAALHELVDAAATAGIHRIVLPSVPATPLDHHVPLAASRRRLEEHLLTAVPASVVLRFPPFMEAWLALAGSSLPLRGEPHATIGRPSPFLRRYRSMTGTSVENRGRLLVPGPTRNRQAFIAVADVATACTSALARDDLAGRTVDVGGPQALSWDDVAEEFAEVLHRPVRAVSTPGAVFAALSAITRPFAPTPSATFALNRWMAASETNWPAGGADLIDPAAMTTVRDFLTAKAALPDTLPEVA